MSNSIVCVGSLAYAAAVPADFATWRPFEIGGMSKRELIDQAERSGVTMTDAALAIIVRPEYTTALQWRRLWLIRYSVRRLGLSTKSAYTTDEVAARIARFGHEPCPDETTLSLAHALAQPREWSLGTIKVLTPLAVFPLQYGGGTCTLDAVSHADCSWSPRDYVVFIRPRT